MKKITLFFVSLIFATLSTFAQWETNFEHGFQIGGIGDDRGRSMATDSYGDIYIIGDFAETVDFDPSSGVTSLTSGGNTDIFIQKFDNQGNLIWVKQLEGSGTNKGYDIFIDDNNNIYTTGAFSNSIDFDPGVGTQIESSTSIASDIFILKLD